MLRTEQLHAPASVAAAYAAVVTAQVGVITAINTQLAQLEAQLERPKGAALVKRPKND